MLFVSQANCLIGNYTEAGSELQLTNFSQQRRIVAAHCAVRHTAARMLLHPRALLRLSRRRPSLALGIAIAAGSAVFAAGAVATLTASQVANRIEMQASVTPLAPAPAPPAPPTPPKKHHFLNGFRANPLRGLASWYGDVWNGRQTASGETFDNEQMTAAHKSLPLGTLVRVTNLNSMRSVIVRINDRGTLAPNRVIDLSSAAAREIGMMEQGLARVKLEVIGKL